MDALDRSNVINSSERNGNLHIKLQGQFGVDTAMELSAHLSQKYRGRGNIFIHTADITAVSPQSKEMFSSMIGVLNLPSGNIYFMGEKATEICSDIGKIIVRKTKKHGHKSCGKCKNCKCKPSQTH